MARVRVLRTLSEDVLAQLRSDILTGALPPGSRLKMADLTARLSVSLSVLREALNRLVEQGLVTLEPQVGFSVVALSADDLADLTAARVHVEGVACRQSVRHGDPRWEAQLLAAHHILASTPTTSGGPDDPVLSQEWVVAHGAFHAALLAACGSKRLLAVAASLRDSAELYRQWSRPLGTEQHRDVAAEHKGLLDAALTRDADRTAELLGAHIQRTTDLVLAAIQLREHDRVVRPA